MRECVCGHLEKNHSICVNPRQRVDCEVDECECIHFTLDTEKVFAETVRLIRG